MLSPALTALNATPLPPTAGSPPAADPGGPGFARLLDQASQQQRPPVPDRPASPGAASGSAQAAGDADTRTTPGPQGQDDPATAAATSRGQRPGAAARPGHAAHPTTPPAAPPGGIAARAEQPDAGDTSQATGDTAAAAQPAASASPDGSVTTATAALPRPSALALQGTEKPADAGRQDPQAARGRTATATTRDSAASPDAEPRRATAPVAGPLTAAAAAAATASEVAASSMKTDSVRPSPPPGAGADQAAAAGSFAAALAAATTAPAAPAQSTTTPADGRLSASPGTPAFAAELGAQVTTFVRDGLHHAVLEIHPADMGPVTVQIQLDGATAQVHLSADHAATRHALSEALPQLAGTLREAGLTLAGGGVFEQPRQAASNGGGEDGRGNGRGRRSDGRRSANAIGADGTADLGAGGLAPAGALRRRGVVDLQA